MIKWSRTIIVALLLIAGCSGHGPLLHDAAVTVTALAGSPIDSVNVSRQGSELLLEVGEIPAAGVFCRIEAGESPGIADQSWTGTDGLLYLAAAGEAGIEIGIVPLAGYRGQNVKAQIRLGKPSRVVTWAPDGFRNIVDDLVIEAVDDGIYRLTWTERNNGDYNLNSLVEVSDLTPIGIHYNTPIPVTGQYSWVDGNGNGFIEITDITPIGQNYQSEIAGYLVWRNGEAQKSPEGEAITVLRPAVTPLDGPPGYEVELAGAAGDSWYVTPVDRKYPETFPGASSITIVSEPFISNPDLLVDFTMSGLETFDVSFRSSSIINDGHQILRIIDPGEIVHNIEIEERLKVDQIGRVMTDATGHSARVDQLPRGVPLFLEVIFAPTVDLSNAIPRYLNPDMIPEEIPDTYFNVVAIPFELAEDSTEPLLILGGVFLERQTMPGPGYNITTTYDCFCPGDAQNGLYRTQQLDFPAGRVRRMAGDQTSADVALITDTDRDSVSDQLLLAKHDEVDYGTAWGQGQFLDATLAEPHELASGVLNLGSVTVYTDIGENHLVSLQVNFNENAVFGEVGAEPGLPDPAPIDPSTLVAGDEVRIRFYFYKHDEEDDAKIWAEAIGLY